jgi:hypothetical protein
MNKQLNNLLNFLDELENIDRYRFEESQWKNFLNRVEHNIQQIFLYIELKNNLEETKDGFELLDKYQTILARIAFKDKLETTPFLREFIRDFDRLDDPQLRLAIFLRFKNSSKGIGRSSKS